MRQGLSDARVFEQVLFLGVLRKPFHRVRTHGNGLETSGAETVRGGFDQVRGDAPPLELRGDLGVIDGHGPVGPLVKRDLCGHTSVVVGEINALGLISKFHRDASVPPRMRAPRRSLAAVYHTCAGFHSPPRSIWNRFLPARLAR